MGFTLKEDMVTYKICLYLLATSVLKKNFFGVTAHCYGHANFRNCQQLTYVMLLTPPEALSSTDVFNRQGYAGWNAKQN